MTENKKQGGKKLYKSREIVLIELALTLGWMK